MHIFTIMLLIQMKYGVLIRGKGWFGFGNLIKRNEVPLGKWLWKFCLTRILLCLHKKILDIDGFVRGLRCCQWKDSSIHPFILILPAFFGVKWGKGQSFGSDLGNAFLYFFPSLM